HLRRSGGDVPGSDHRLDARHRFRGTCVDRDDARVRMRAAKHGAIQQARQAEVGAIGRPAGHFVDAVVPRRSGSDVLELTFAHTQLSTLNSQLSTLNFQLSSLNFQLSTFNSQDSTLEWIVESV